ncbi:unknown [Enterocloster bolteae CAG:59]|nr:unknown [Enterocloster bolteae CAG:59]
MPKGRCTSISTMVTSLSSTTCMTGPIPSITTRNVPSITRKGVIIRSRALGIIFLSFFSMEAPRNAARIAVRTLP